MFIGLFMLHELHTLSECGTVSCRYDNLNNGLAVIRDKVTPEEISEVIINPRKRDLSSLSSVQNQVSIFALALKILHQ